MASRALNALVVCLCLGLAACTPTADSVRVIEVTDGDTIRIEGGLRVRYIGIDTPEMGTVPEPFAVEATEANRHLVEGKRVRLEKDVSDTDRYERLLRYVYAGEVLVNAELVRLGLARAVAYPPDTRYQDVLEEAEAAARKAGRGMWAK